MSKDFITPYQMVKFWNLVAIGEINRENFENFLCDPQNEVVYVALVNYDGLSLADMIKAGDYSPLHEEINEENFPIPFEESGKVLTTFRLIKFNEKISLEDVISSMKAMVGFRPATLRELLSFGAQYPEIQRKFSIICPGSPWIDSCGELRMPYLSGDGSRRGLQLRRGNVDKSCRVLVVRKTP